MKRRAGSAKVSAEPAKPAPPPVARAWGGAAVPKILTVLAMAYFTAIFLDGAAKGLPARVLPRPLAYFTQTTALFTHAATFSIEYRAEGFHCDGERWTEIDVRKYFPMDADDKESRFQRAMHFYGQTRQVMQALEEYVMTRYNQDALAAAAAGRGAEADPIAGVRFLRLNIPFGKEGEGADRYERRPLASYPEEIRKPLYFTPVSKREERCKKSAP